MERVNPFVGRELEVAEIRAALDRALAGQGGLLLLAGEPGIGKTRLADPMSSRPTPAVEPERAAA